MSNLLKILAGLLVLIIAAFVIFQYVTPHENLVEKNVERLLREGKTREAERIVDENLSPSEPIYHILKGRIFVEEAEYYQALRELQSVVYKTLNDDQKAKLIGELIYLAQKAASDGRNQIARKAYEYLLQLEPDYDLGEGFKFLAEFYFKGGEFGHSIPYFERYISQTGNLDAVLNEYVKALFEEGEYDRILRLRDEILSNGDDNAQRYLLFSIYYLARDDYQKGNYQAAIDLLKEFFNIARQVGQPRYVWEDAALLLADCYRELGDIENARRWYENILVFGETENKRIAEQRLKELEVRP